MLSLESALLFKDLTARLRADADANWAQYHDAFQHNNGTRMAYYNGRIEQTDAILDHILAILTAAKAAGGN